MAGVPETKLRPEIAHVLFIDIVGYSKLLITEQSEQLQKLNEIVRSTEQFRLAEGQGRLLRLPTGDGGALIFRNSPEAPVLCALEISRALKRNPELRVRMGIHSGPVNEVADLNEQPNVAGAGINIAQRVMDCGDAGHILISKHVANDIDDYPQWRPYLHDLGDCEVKHGLRVGVVNVYDDETGNPQLPKKFQLLRKRGAQRRWGLIATAALLLAAIVAAFLFVLHRPTRAISAIPERSIAVLPFENLSNDKSNAYFAEGIQDEILTRLAKIGGLKVISRTSTSHYASSPQNLTEIARQLGVANILEGSVQKVANAVHVNVQLIRAATDDHVWAESYNRTLDDIFGVEGEVAGAIAEQLNTKLTGTEQQALAQRPTNNAAAYDAYLRGLAFQGRIDALEPNTRNSIQAFEEAVRLDPGFASAWAHASRQHSFLFNISDQSRQRAEAAHRALETAMKLGPTLPETQSADAFYHYWVEHDYADAKGKFEAMRRQYPNDAWPPYALAAIARRENQWEKSRLLFAQAIELNPRDVFLLVDAALDDVSMRDSAAALKRLDLAHNLSPQNAAVLVLQAASFVLAGDIGRAQAVLDRAQPAEGDVDLVSTIARIGILSRNYGPAMAVLKAQLEKPEALRLTRGNFEMILADLQRQAGDPAAATTYRQARESLEMSLRDQPDNTYLLSNLGWVEAQLGEKAAALKHAQEAVALLPASKDALIGPLFEESLARVQAHFGETDHAIGALQHLLVTSYGGTPPVCPAVLRLDPDWDNLRGDPRFEKLCQEKQP